MDKFVDIITFLRIVERQSFTGAAVSLGVSKSVVSRRLSDLENRLGARLLNRTTRRLNPTEVGKSFYERCLRITSELEDAEAAISNLQDRPRGALKISTSVAFGQTQIAPRLGRFHKRYPEITVDLHVEDRFVDLIEHGYDLAIRIGTMAASSLIARKLGVTKLVAVAAPGYVASHGAPSGADDLSRHPGLIYDHPFGGEFWRWTTQSGGVQSARMQGTIRSNDGGVLAAAAAGGCGIAILPLFMVRDMLADGQLERVLADVINSDLGIHAVYPHGRHLSPKIRVFIDFLVQELVPVLKSD